MTDRQITIYLSVGGASEEDIFRRVTELLKNIGHEVIGRHFAWSAVDQPEVFEADVKVLMRGCSVFVGILGGDNDQRGQTDSVAVETGPSATEIEYFAAATLGVPQLLYVRKSVLDSDRLPFRLLPDAPKPHLVRRFIYDEELLKRLPEDLVLILRQQQEALAERGPETGGTDSKITEQSSEQEGYNEQFQAARDQVSGETTEKPSEGLGEHEAEQDLLMKRGRLDEAEHLYRQTIERFPEDTVARNGLAEVLIRRGRLEEAEQVYGETIETFPDDLVARNGLAEMLIRRGRLEEAERLYRETMDRFPDDLVAPKGLSQVIGSLIALEEAKQAHRESVENPEDTVERKISPSKPGVTYQVPSGSISTTVEAPPKEISNADSLAYSESALRSLQLAEQTRSILALPRIRRTVLLLGLLLQESPDNPASVFLRALGISNSEVFALVAQKLASGPAAITASLIGWNRKKVELIGDQLPGSQNFSENARNALRIANSTAQAMADTEVQPSHILAGLLRSSEEARSWIVWMLGEEKAEWIQKTLSEWPRGKAIEEELVRQKALEAGLYSPPSASSDAAAKDDLLNFKQSARAMVNIVLKQDTVPPLVIGVYGPWGSGKSTYLELVKAMLKPYTKNKNAIDNKKAVKLLVVEYDAWAYSDAPKLWAGLITKIARKLDEDLGFWGRIKYLFKTHRARFLSGLLLGLIPIALAIPAVVLGVAKPLTAWLSAAAGPLISLVSAWLAQRQAVFGNVRSLASKFDSAPASGVINSIQDEFKHALESWIEQKTGADAADATIEQRVRDNNLKIVVFIDELDRCPLERIVDILEAIKLFLAKEIFIVFMAVDTRVASEAIRLHYKDVRNPDLPREYLEKIVQLPLRVPTAKGKLLTAYLKKFMPNVKDDEPSDGQGKDLSAGAASPPLPTGRSAVPDAVPAAISNSPKAINPMDQWRRRQPVSRAPTRKTPRREFADPSPMFSLPQLPDTKTELRMLETFSERFLESNPRRIKRLLNTYRYVKVLAHSHSHPVQTEEWQKTMLGWLSFTMTWPAFMARAIEKVSELEPQSSSFLLREIEKIPDGDPRPTKEDVQAYLDINGEKIKELWELAGNFLIENADPGSASHSNAPDNTRAGAQS